MKTVNSTQKSLALIRIIFYGALFLLILLASVTYKNYLELNEINTDYKRKFEVALELEKMMSFLKDAETSDRGFTLTNDSIFLEPYVNARNNINTSFYKLKNATKNDTIQQAKLKKIYQLVDKRFVYFSKDFFTSNEFKKNFIEGKNVMDSLRLEINSLINKEEKSIKETNVLFNINSYNTPLIIFSSFLVAILIVVFGYFKITKNLKQILEQNIQLKINEESNKQSEIIGKYGSWIYKINEGTFWFSENFYNLFEKNSSHKLQSIEPFLEHISSEEKETVIAFFNSCSALDQYPEITFTVSLPNEKIVILKTKSKPFTDRLGNKMLLGTTQDITEDYEKSLLIEERNKQLEQNIKELTEFNYVASHDLQEPLRKIQTFISRIDTTENANLSENGQLYFSRIKTAATRMRILIDDLLNYSRTNKSQDTFETVDVNQIITAIRKEQSEIFKEKNIAFHQQTLPEIQGVSFQIQQLFVNLISNSIKYAKQNERLSIAITTSEITSEDRKLVKLDKNKSYYKITYTDNGIGFDNSYSDRIFNLFQRLHTKTEYEGTGVGLAICKKIMENHNGFIKAHAEINKGATFTMYFLQ
ncbi:MAG: CHASE3 domain-containing protein [Flavobacterium sp.]|jgi:hypothetical protein|nr:CHASE3 domain-containing protein [Flavobacterium sp.]